MQMIALLPTIRAARATPWAWLHDEYATTPRARSASRSERLREQTVEGRGRAKILLLDISGFLSDEGGPPSLVIGGPTPPRVPLLVRVREELTKAAADPQVRALVVRIDSAGGTVTASDVIYRELVLFKRETGRPVVAVMLDVAPSGGYYVALAEDTIIAHPT